MISQNNKTNSSPRIRVIQKIYGYLMNPDEQIIYSKSQYKKFIKDAYAYRSRYEKGNMNFLQNKRSRYNKKVVMDCCKMCGAKDNLHTHHICEQREADDDGVIGQQFHKNVRHNLLVLCETCHQKIHN